MGRLHEDGSMKKKNILDFASLATLIVTLVMFVTAAYVHGASQELLLEAGVFLVSVKLVLSGRKVEILIEELREEIRALKK